MTLDLSRRQFLGGSLGALGSLYVHPVFSQNRRPKLPIPQLLDASDEEPIPLDIRQGQWAFRPGVMTPTLGVNQDYLGPTLRTRKNTQMNLHYRNGLNQGVAMHAHGLHVPGNVDGGPQLEIAPGGEWTPSLSIVQPAATTWYHSHTHGVSGEQVYRGLAGMILIDDDESDAMDLPDQYGIDDLPVIIQDRSFDQQGHLVYSLKDAGQDGWYGDTLFINGAISPVAHVPAGQVRLRLLNGANARFYIIAFKDNRSFYKIASDGGLLEAPVALDTMEMSPGERCEIIVDLSDGKPADLMALFEDEYDEEGEGIISSLQNLLGARQKPLPDPALSLIVDPKLKAQTAPLPDRLTTIVRPKPSDIVTVRDFILEMKERSGSTHSGSHGSHGSMDMMINGAVMDMNVINERVQKGVWERWRIRSTIGAHPFHVHGCSFLIDKLEGETTPLSQRGWKDTVIMDDDDWSEILVRFDHRADENFPYMYHCHILEHEDMGMMGQFTVS